MFSGDVESAGNLCHNSDLGGELQELLRWKPLQQQGWLLSQDQLPEGTHPPAADTTASPLSPSLSPDKPMLSQGTFTCLDTAPIIPAS